MNKTWLVLGLIGGVLYWLSKEPPRRAADARLDPDDEQELLDEALDKSFPASDPPAVTPTRH